jgi:hypothetical protein
VVNIEGEKEETGAAEKRTRIYLRIYLISKIFFFIFYTAAEQ